MQIAGDVAGTATDVGNRTETVDLGNNEVKQRTVERFVCEFAEELVGIAFGDGVVASLRVIHKPSPLGLCAVELMARMQG